jgi:hypothetical protein
LTLTPGEVKTDTHGYSRGNARPMVKFPRRRDGVREARIRAAIATDLLTAQLEAARYVRELVRGNTITAGDTKLTNRDRAAFLMAQGTMAMERAKTVQPTTQKLGVIVIERRLTDTPENRRDWEAEARELQNARVIEATATPALPERKGDGT